MWIFKRKNNEENHVLQESLLTSSASFLELYSQRQDDLVRASDGLRQLAVQICKKKKKEERWDKASRALFGALAGGALGAALGATIGAIAGGASSAVGTDGVVAFDCSCSDINAVGVSIGFVGGVIGGAVGGTFSGALGGAIGAAAEATGHPIQSDIYDQAWVTIGGATGGAIAYSIFGETVGATGGAIGGAFGGFCGLRVAVGAVRSLNYNVKEIRKTQQSETQQAEIQRVEVLQKTGQDYQETIKPLLEELNRIKTISKKMEWSACVGSVAGQSTKTLTALATTEKVLSKIQTTKDEAKMMSWIEEAAQKSTQITEELQKMKAEVEKLLASLRKC
ncbi:keratin, type I cytoskeletal 14-like [Sphaeramia orbicularis]|uniref:keratin, type I cytoskeletal 14-like n=1 Tax=Sphaeramia orbicularis TaxID=375764 RepID=UPI00117FBD0E|nr:keratin, type I cytoskeletal 14-like [Sphaeramia orbicularis]XP_029978148.1 keratin, type I cytoskeletal 14-like [Sphaeramia orbicularis]